MKNVLRNACNYCKDHKVKCSGIIFHGRCAQCTRHDAPCFFGARETPGPKPNQRRSTSSPQSASPSEPSILPAGSNTALVGGGGGGGGAAGRPSSYSAAGGRGDGIAGFGHELVAPAGIAGKDRYEEGVEEVEEEEEEEEEEEDEVVYEVRPPPPSLIALPPRGYSITGGSFYLPRPDVDVRDTPASAPVLEKSNGGGDEFTTLWSALDDGNEIGGSGGGGGGASARNSSLFQPVRGRAGGESATWSGTLGRGSGGAAAEGPSSSSGGGDVVRYGGGSVGTVDRLFSGGGAAAPAGQEITAVSSKRKSVATADRAYNPWEATTVQQQLRRQQQQQEEQEDEHPIKKRKMQPQQRPSSGRIGSEGGGSFQVRTSVPSSDTLNRSPVRACGGDGVGGIGGDRYCGDVAGTRGDMVCWPQQAGLVAGVHGDSGENDANNTKNSCSDSTSDSSSGSNGNGGGGNASSNNIIGSISISSSVDDDSTLEVQVIPAKFTENQRVNSSTGW